MKVNNNVLAVLSACKTEGNKLFITEQLDRNMYTQVNKVLEAAGGKWDRKSKSHIFPVAADEALDPVMLSGEITIAKDEFDFFPTPKVIAEEMAEMLGVEDGDFVLEPSAGHGALIDAVLLQTEAAGITAVVDAVELNQDCFKLLAAKYKNVSTFHIDFLKFKPLSHDGFYDRVIMNPPFSKRADIHHVTHAFNLLRPGGKLVAVMGAGITFRNDSLTKRFLDMMNEQGDEFTVKDLPAGSFKESGTMVNTVLVSVVKK